MDARQKRRYLLAVTQIILTRVETSSQGNCGVAASDCQLLLFSPAAIQADHKKHGLPEPGQVSDPHRSGPSFISSPPSAASIVGRLERRIMADGLLQTIGA